MSERRELSAFDIGCVVVGGIIGVGIFFTPQKVAAAVDSSGQVMLAWALGGVLAVLGAIVFAELSLAVPGHGGMFRYLRAAFGDRVAFLYGWGNWLVIQSGAAGIVALLLVNYLEQALGWAGSWPEPGKVALAALTIALFVGLNVLGLRTGKRVQNALTVFKVAALSWLVGLAIFAAPAEPAAAAAAAGSVDLHGPGSHGAQPPAAGDRSLVAMLAAAILPVLFAMGGWQQGSFVAGAARRPASVALGVLGGVAVVVVAYMMVNVAYLELLGFEGARTSSAIGAAAAEAAMGEVGGRILAAMVVVSAAGVLNTICLAPPYVLYAMAREGCFPARFGHLHPRFGTPVLGVLGQGAWAIVLLWLAYGGIVCWGDGSTIATLGFVCTGVVHVDWLFFGLCGVALLRLRRRAGPDAPRRLPGGAVAAVLFALGAVAVTVGAFYSETEASFVGTGLVLLGCFFLPRTRQVG
ncbi:MAG: APC family permease [bacterium]|nr:APC family permease [bacterium]